jgi:hypothetical protein
MWTAIVAGLRIAGIASLGYALSDIINIFVKPDPVPPPTIDEAVKKWWHKWVIAGVAVLLASVAFSLIFPALTKNRK